MEKKENIYIVLIATALTLVSLSFVADNTLFGLMPPGFKAQGFPFHFFEPTGLHGQVPRFLVQWFFADIVWYAILLRSICYLFKLGLNGTWKPLTIAIILGLSAFWINIVSNDSCVAGFPIEFYLRCTADGSIGAGYLLAGFIINPLFWFCLSSASVALIYWVYKQKIIASFLINRNFYWTVFSACIVLILITILGIIGNTSGESGIWFDAILAIIGFSVLPFLGEFYKKSKEEGKKLFFSKVGYISLGVVLGLIIIFTAFNLSYEGGWFDFTDFGFYFLSMPLSAFLHFEGDNDMLSKRLILYAIAVINSIILIYILDIIGFLAIKIVQLFRKKIINKTGNKMTKLSSFDY